MHLLLRLCVIVVNVNTLFGLSGENVCNKTEKYSVSTMVKTNIPVKVRSSGWCIAIPPRCSQYQTIMREVWKEQVEQKTRQILVCCPGYYESQELCIRNCSVAIPGTTKDDLCETEPTKNITQTNDMKQNNTEKSSISTIIKNISVALQNTITINEHVMVIPKSEDDEQDSKNKSTEPVAETTFASEDKEFMTTPENAYNESTDIDKTKILHSLAQNLSVVEPQGDFSNYIEVSLNDSIIQNDNFSLDFKDIELSMSTTMIATSSNTTLEDTDNNYAPLEIASALVAASIILALVVTWIVRIRKTADDSSSNCDTSVLRKKESRNNGTDNEVIKARHTYKRSSDLATTSSGSITYQNPIFSSMTQAIRSNRVFACSSCARIVFIDEKGGLKNIINQEHICPCQSGTANRLRLENRQFGMSQQQLPKPPLELPSLAIANASKPEEDSTYEIPVLYENIEKTDEPLYAEIKLLDDEN